MLYGTSDAFLTELTIYSSTIIYSTYLGGENDDQGQGVAIASNGQVYVAVTTDSNMFPLAGPAYNPNNSGGYDIAVALFDVTQSGTSSLVYSTYLGGSQNDVVRGVALDPQGNLLITGYTLSRDFPVTSDAAQFSYGGNGDVFVVAVNAMTPRAFLKYSTFLGGSDGDVAYAVASDPSGNIYVTGYTLSPDFPITSNAPQPHWGQGIDIFLVKLTPHIAGPSALQYSTYLGGATVNTGLALTVGPDGTAYAAGKTGGELPTTSNAAQGGFNGGAVRRFSRDCYEVGPSFSASRQMGAPATIELCAASGVILSLSRAGYGFPLFLPRPPHGPRARRAKRFRRACAATPIRRPNSTSSALPTPRT